MELWSGCIAGALLESEYVGKLKAAGFTSIEVEPTRVYTSMHCTNPVLDEARGPRQIVDRGNGDDSVSSGKAAAARQAAAAR